MLHFRVPGEQIAFGPPNECPWGVSTDGYSDLVCRLVHVSGIDFCSGPIPCAFQLAVSYSLLHHIRCILCETQLSPRAYCLHFVIGCDSRTTFVKLHVSQSSFVSSLHPLTVRCFFVSWRMCTPTPATVDLFTSMSLQWYFTYSDGTSCFCMWISISLSHTHPASQ